MRGDPELFVADFHDDLLGDASEASTTLFLGLRWETH